MIREQDSPQSRRDRAAGVLYEALELPVAERNAFVSASGLDQEDQSDVFDMIRDIEDSDGFWEDSSIVRGGAAEAPEDATSDVSGPWAHDRFGNFNLADRNSFPDPFVFRKARKIFGCLDKKIRAETANIPVRIRIQ